MRVKLFKYMTDITRSQQKRLTSIVDLSWEFEQERDLVRKWELVKTINQMKGELKEAIGHEKYEHYLRTTKEFLGTD